MVDAPPSGLSEPLVGALHELASTDRLLVALDFDGTLAPTVDDPDQARALPQAHEAMLRLLALPRTRVALVSGRAMESLIRVTEMPGTALLVGSHGIELRLDSPDAQVWLDPAELERVDALGKVLGKVADSFARVWLESKPAGFALHTRTATEADGALAHRIALRETAEGFTGLTVRGGKDVLEFSVRSTTKGEAVERLRGYTEATAVLYAGDDVTDEDAFAALGAGDVGLKSGPGTTVAGFRVGGPEEVARAIALLADLRDAGLRES